MSTIDHTFMLNRARAFIGQSVVGPVDFTDDDLLKCLDEVTLPIFSAYMPHYVDHLVDCTTEKAFPDREDIYLLRPPGLKVIGVNAIRDRNVATDFAGSVYDPRGYTEILDRQFATDFLSAADITLTFQYREPGMVEIFPKGYNFENILVQLKVVHPLTLRTVPHGAIETLKELYLADVAADLLGVRSYFQQLSSVHGDIQMNLERLSAKADKRDDIIARLEAKQHKHGMAQRIWIG